MIAEQGLDMMTAREVAVLVRVSERHIVRLATANAMPATRIGGVWRFNRPDVLAWIREQSNRGTAHGRL